MVSFVGIKRVPLIYYLLNSSSLFLQLWSIDLKAENKWQTVFFFSNGIA